MCMECTRQFKETWRRLPNGEYLYTMEVYAQQGYLHSGWHTIVEQTVSAHDVPLNQLQREAVQWQR